MKPSGWLYLVAACLAVLGFWVLWPFVIIAVFVSLAAFKARQNEKKAALAASTAWPRR